MKLNEWLLPIATALFEKKEDADLFVSASALKDIEVPDDVAAKFNQKFLTRERAFTDEDIVKIVRENRDEIDKVIETSAEHWDIKRMAVVDRNILRLGVSEILYAADVPVKVAINESIELAKKFGDQESSRFVNGILDQIAKKHAPADKKQ